MSQENVEIVSQVYAAWEEDAVQMTRDDDLWAAFVERVTPHVHSDFDGILGTGVDGGTEPFSGLDGLRAACLDWYTPLSTFRWEIEEAIDLDDRVLLLLNEYAQLQGSEAEIKLSPAHVITLRDGRIIHAETYPHRADALKAVGLEE